MKKLLKPTLVFITVAACFLALTSFGQTNMPPLMAVTTNADGSFTLTPTTNSPAGNLPVTATSVGQDFLDIGQKIINSTNMLWEAHGMYASALQQKIGGGIGGYYLFNQYTYAGLRLDWVNGGFWMPEGNAGVQLPITITSWLKLTPFTYAGIGLPLSGAQIGPITLGGSPPRDNDGQATAIIGAGLAAKFFSFDGNKWDIGGLYDAEKWTGFSGTQMRFGLFAKRNF